MPTPNGHRSHDEQGGHGQRGGTPGRTAARAAALRELHERSGVLVLPNAWDVASARLFAALPGVTALATTSAGIAASAGFPDGEVLGGERMLSAVARICAAVDLPVSADLESGYGDVAAIVEEALHAGCAGINLEDGDPADPTSLVDPEQHAEAIATAREVATRRGVDLVINARTDVYWRRWGEPADRFGASIARLQRYARAGADCVFPPGFPHPRTPAPCAEIRRLVDELGGTPVNLLATPSTPPVDVLAETGVRRLTLGSGLYRVALAGARRAAASVLGPGTPSALRTAEQLPYAELRERLE